MVLKFEQGNFSEGFAVTARIGKDDGRHLSTGIPGKFPSSSEVPQSYQQWLSDYQELDLIFRMSTEKPQILNTGEILEKCRQSSENFKNSVREWLLSEDRDFRDFREKLCQKLGENKKVAVRVIIQTEDDLLKKLPWHEWDLFADTYTNSEIALCPNRYDHVPERKTRKAKVRILAILGSDEGINVEDDRRLLEGLMGAYTTFLPKTQRSELSDHLWEQEWDILFFAGHSSSRGKRGQICINRTESLSIGDLKQMDNQQMGILTLRGRIPA